MTGRGFQLTRRAAIDLREIYRRSRLGWGKDTADRYLADLYSVMSRAAADPDAGRLRQHRSTPFLMVAARKHFIVYDEAPDGIVILTLVHQVRDIETLIAEMTPVFLQELDRLKRRRTQ